MRKIFLSTLLLTAGIAHAQDEPTDPALVKEINATVNIGGNSSVSNFVDADSLLIFRANDGDGFKLFRTDGTTAGTQPIIPEAITPFNLTDGPGFVIFRGDTDAAGREPWVSDGTAEGTFQLLDIFPGPEDSGPSEFTTVGDFVYFVAEDPTNGEELWRTDGTTAGTTLVSDIEEGSDGSEPDDLTAGDGVLFFTASTDENGEELWISDGTAAGTTLLFDAFPGDDGDEEEPEPNDGEPDNLTYIDGTLYFAAFNEDIGEELYTSDGTTAGTGLLLDVYPGLDEDEEPNEGSPDDFTAVDGTVFFTATDDEGTELWKTDGTAAGTEQVEDINEDDDSNPARLTAYNGLLIFTAQTEADGRELWRSDGTGDGTVQIRDIRDEEDDSSNPNFFVLLDDTLFFSANDGDGSELWKTDGTTDGTVRLSTIRADGNAAVNNLVAFNQSIYFAANDGVIGIELYRYRVPNLTVSFNGAGLASGDTISFGMVGQGLDSLLLLTIENTGTGALTVSEVLLEGDVAFQVPGISVPDTFPGNSSETLNARFAPTIDTELDVPVTATLTVRSDDLDEDVFSLVLTGTAVTVISLPSRASEVGIAVFPNPTADVARVQLPATLPADGTWTLTDALGREVGRAPLRARAFTVPLRHLPPGTYYLTLRTSGGAWQQPLLRR